MQCNALIDLKITQINFHWAFRNDGTLKVATIELPSLRSLAITHPLGDSRTYVNKICATLSAPALETLKLIYWEDPPMEGLGVPTDEATFHYPSVHTLHLEHMHFRFDGGNIAAALMSATPNVVHVTLVYGEMGTFLETATLENSQTQHPPWPKLQIIDWASYRRDEDAALVGLIQSRAHCQYPISHLRVSHMKELNDMQLEWLKLNQVEVETFTFDFKFY